MAPTSNQLAEFDESLWYHVGVLVSQSKLYLQGGEVMAGSVQYAAADALFEMLLVRLRAFDSFFGSAVGQPDDALAVHFVAGWSPSHFLTTDERTNINKRLAHLTYSQPHTHEWAVGKMIRRCLETIRDFLQAIGNGLSERWTERRDEVIAFLDGDFQSQTLDSIWTETDKHAHRR